MFPTTTLPDMIPEAEFIQERRTFVDRHLAKCHADLTAKGVNSTSSVEIGNDVVRHSPHVVMATST